MTDHPGRAALADIVEGLRGVTPGPWGFSGTRYRMNSAEWQNIFNGNDLVFAVVNIEPHTLAGLKDGKHIARCHPQAISSIAAYVAEQDEQIRQLEAALSHVWSADAIRALNGKWT